MEYSWREGARGLHGEELQANRVEATTAWWRRDDRSGSRTLSGTEIIGNKTLGPQEAEGRNLVPCLGPTPERD